MTTTTARMASKWANFLAERFRGTEYDAGYTSFWAWASAGNLGHDDDPENVADAWVEQCRDGQLKL